MSTVDDTPQRTAQLRAELTRWRKRRGLSLRALASQVGCDHSQLWKIEHGKTTMTRSMVEACDHALDADGALITAWMKAHGRVRPAQLPAVPGQVVGRDIELATAHAALRTARNERPGGTPLVIAIDGPAGAGKTTLALRWAHQVTADHIDGQLYTDLRAFTPTSEPVGTDVALEEFLTALGANPVPSTPHERAALYRSLLTGRNVLIVLDDADNLADIQALLPGSSGCTVVVTSRRTLSGLVAHHGAIRITLGSFTEPDSRTMVTRLIGARRAHAEPSAVTALTRLCGHLPLALRIVAEHVATYPHRSVADLVDELTDTTDSTGTTGNADDTGDSQLGWMAMTDTEELRGAFFGSYRRLTPDAARLLRVLGLYPRPHLTVPAAAALAGATLPHTRRLLHQLTTLHLVTIDSDQVIRLHALIRAYARHLTTAALNHETDPDTSPDTDRDTNETDDGRAAVRRLATWYLTAVHTASNLLVPGYPEPSPRDTPPRIGRADAGSTQTGIGTGTTERTSAGTAAGAAAVVDDATAASAWRHAASVHYPSLLRMALVHDPEVTAPRLAAELGRVALLHLTPARTGEPADQPVTAHVQLADDRDHPAPTHAPAHTPADDSRDGTAAEAGCRLPLTGRPPGGRSRVPPRTRSDSRTARPHRDPLPLTARSSRPPHGEQPGRPPHTADSKEIWDLSGDDRLVQLLQEAAARLGLT